VDAGIRTHKVVALIARARVPVAIFGGALLALAPGCTSPSAPDEPEETQEITTRIPLDLMKPNQRYYGLPGGLVESGDPTVTPANGRIVIISISMSNGNIEFSRYVELYSAHAEIHPQVGLVNCAVGGNALEDWTAADDRLWETCSRRIQSAGFSLAQVRVVWAKDADEHTEHGRTLPNPQADYYDLVRNIAELSRRIAREFPSVQAIFHTSRIYGGYPTDPQLQRGRGEPLCYEGGFAVNAVIEQYNRGELTGTPWIGWGPYLWSNGAEPNGSGISWLLGDYDESYPVHVNQAGATKVANALHRFFLQYAWYRR
jgi:hypothetical protein